MCVCIYIKFPLRYLNICPYFSHPTSIYICRVTIIPRVYSVIVIVIMLMFVILRLFIMSIGKEVELGTKWRWWLLFSLLQFCPQTALYIYRLGSLILKTCLSFIGQSHQLYILTWVSVVLYHPFSHLPESVTLSFPFPSPEFRPK